MTSSLTSSLAQHSTAADAAPLCDHAAALVALHHLHRRCGDAQRSAHFLLHLRVKLVGRLRAREGCVKVAFVRWSYCHGHAYVPCCVGTCRRRKMQGQGETQSATRVSLGLPQTPQATPTIRSACRLSPLRNVFYTVPSLEAGPLRVGQPAGQVGRCQAPRNRRSSPWPLIAIAAPAAASVRARGAQMPSAACASRRPAAAAVAVAAPPAGQPRGAGAGNVHMRVWHIAEAN